MAQHEPTALPPELVLDEPPVDEETLAGLATNDPEPIELGSWEEVEWAFRRLARSRSALDVLATRYGEMVGRIEEWYASEAAADRRTVDYLTGLIERYGVAHRQRDPKTATLRFPSGEVKTTFRREPRVDVTDEKELISWCLGHMSPEEAQRVIAQQLSIRVTALREHVVIAAVSDTEDVAVTRDGEPVPGVVVKPPEITAKIQLTQEDPDQ